MNISRTTVLSPAALTMGQNVSLLTSVTFPTVTVGPAVSKLDLTLRPPFFLKLNLCIPTFFELKMEEENEVVEEEACESFDDEALSKTVVPIHLGEVQRFRAIDVERRRVENWTGIESVVLDVKRRKSGSDEGKDGAALGACVQN